MLVAKPTACFTDDENLERPWTINLGDLLMWGCDGYCGGDGNAEALDSINFFFSHDLHPYEKYPFSHKQRSRTVLLKALKRCPLV